MFAWSLAFMLSCTLAFAAGLGLGLGGAVAVVFVFGLLFELSAVLQAAPKVAKANKIRKPVVRRISIPPMSINQKSLGGQFKIFQSRSNDLNSSLLFRFLEMTSQDVRLATSPDGCAPVS